MTLPIEAVEFARESCLRRVYLLNTLRKARFMATCEGKVRVVDRAELVARRAGYQLAEAIRLASAEVAELREEAARNGFDPSEAAREGMRLAREKIRADHPIEQQFLYRGHGIYPGARDRIERDRAEAGEVRQGRQWMEAVKAEADARAEADRVARERQAARKAEARRLRESRKASVLDLPRPGKGTRLGLAITPDMLLDREVLHRETVRMNVAHCVVRDLVRLEFRGFASGSPVASRPETPGTIATVPMAKVLECYVVRDGVIRPVRGRPHATASR